MLSQQKGRLRSPDLETVPTDPRSGKGCARKFPRRSHPCPSRTTAPTAGPLVIAHRGASAAHPENTVAAFVGAREMGADGVELDARRTADGAGRSCTTTPSWPTAG